MSEGAGRIYRLLCQGCSFTAKGSSWLATNNLEVRVDSYRTYDEEHTCGHEVRNDGYCRSILSNIPSSKSSCKIIQESYTYNKAGQFHISGDLTLDASSVNVYVSNLVIHGKLFFRNPAGISVYTETFKMYPNFDIANLDGGRSTRILKNLLICNPIISFEKLKYFVDRYEERGTKKITNTLNSIFHAGVVEGATGSMSIGAISRGSYVSSLLEESSYRVKMQESSRALVVANQGMEQLGSQLSEERGSYIMLDIHRGDEITRLFIERSKLRDWTLDAAWFKSSRLNPYIYKEQNMGSLPGGSSTALVLYPMHMLNAEPEAYDMLSDTIGLADYLSAIGKSGVLPIIGDGYYIKNELIPNALYQLGVILEMPATEAAEVLLKNALEAYNQDRTIIPGKALTWLQKEVLDKPILHLLWNDRCQGNIGCYSFELVFDDITLSNFLEGAVLSLGSKRIELKVNGDVFVGKVGGIYKHGEELTVDLQGDFLNMGEITCDEGFSINAGNIGNLGDIKAEKGNVELSARENLINAGEIDIEKGGKIGLKSNGQTVNLGKIVIEEDGEIEIEGREIYEPVYVGTHLGKEVVQSAYYHIKGNGKLSYKGEYHRSSAAKRAATEIEYDVTYGPRWSSLHLERVANTETGKNYYLINRVIDEYVDINYAEKIKLRSERGKCIGEGNVLIGKKQIEIDCEEFDFETITSYAINEYKKDKSKAFGKSSKIVRWTSSTTSRATIGFGDSIEEMPELIIRANKCVFEGEQLPETGKGRFILDCKTYQFPDHKINNWVEQITKKSGMLSPSVPLVDLMKSDQPEKYVVENMPIGGPLRGITKMEGPLDLWPVMEFASDIVGFNKDMKAYQDRYKMNQNGAIFMALVSKYVSATLHIGFSKRVEYTFDSKSILTEGNFEEADIRLGEAIDEREGSKVKLKAKKMRIKVDGNFKLEGGRNRAYRTVEEESGSFDVGGSLTGVKIGFSVGNSAAEMDAVSHVKAEIAGDDLELIVNGKLEIEGAEISGKKVKVDALEVMIQDVLDTVHSDSSGSSMSMGISIGWKGGILPYGSFSNMDHVKNSGFVSFISGITGERVEVVTKKLIYNVAQITESEELKIKADEIEYTEKLEGYEDERETRIRLSADIGFTEEGKPEVRASGGVYHKDNDFVISGYMSSNLLEGIKDVYKFINSGSGEEDEEAVEKEYLKFLKSLLNEEKEEEANKKSNPAKGKEEKQKVGDQKEEELNEAKPQEKKEQEIIENTHIVVAREIDKIDDLTGAQKAEYKARFKDLAERYISANAEEKQQILNGVYTEMHRLESELEEGKQRNGWSKVTGFFKEVFGVKEAEAAVPLALLGGAAVEGVAAADTLLKIGALFLSALGLSYAGKKAVDNAHKNDDSNTNEDILEKQKHDKENKKDNTNNNQWTTAGSPDPNNDFDNEPDDGREEQKFKDNRALEEHYDKHKSEWGGKLSKEEYLSKARELLNKKPNENILEYVKSNGDIRRYDMVKNEFISARKDGTIRSFFKPKDGITYWNNLYG